MDAKITDYKELTTIIRGSKYFVKLSIKVKIQELRLTKDLQKLDWNNPNRREVVTVLDAGHLVKATMKPCKTIFNSERKKYPTAWGAQQKNSFHCTQIEIHPTQIKNRGSYPD